MKSIKKKKILVLTDDKPWGHRSIAKAIYQYLKDNESKNNYQVGYVEVKADGSVLDDIYKFYYKYSPKLGKIAYDSMNNRLANKIMDDVVKRNLLGLKKVINKIGPDLIISAYFLHSHSLDLWRREDKKNFGLWTVVADPWSISPITIVPGADLHLVYDKVGMDLAVKMGVPKEKILVTGWWVRPDMDKKVDKEKARKNLGVKDDRPVVFIGGGSLGTSALPKLLPSLFFLKKKVFFIVNTGADKLAYSLVKNYIRLFRRLRKDNLVLVKNMGWIDNMAEVLSACDIVFGKAGPNFLFDCVASRKPFVAITHIGGQEDGNIDLIKKKKLGWVKERTDEMNKFLVEYLNNPRYFEKKYEKNILKEADNNKKALPLILEKIKESSHQKRL
jgi:processive 1,2-diacylglycerol beta-glucosyltransferase